MNQQPKVFTTICNIAEMPTDKVNQTWHDLSEKVIGDFLNYLIQENDLNEEQEKSLEEILTNVNSENKPTEDSVINLVSPILNENQKDEAIKKFAELFSSNLESFYAAIKKSMTVEQRQVADSYLKSSYVRTDN